MIFYVKILMKMQKVTKSIQGIVNNSLGSLSLQQFKPCCMSRSLSLMI